MKDEYLYLLEILEKILLDEKYYKKIIKTILQYDKNNNFIAKYSSLAEIENKLKIHHSNISKCLHNKRKTTGGFIWKYQYQKILEDIKNINKEY